MNSCILHGAQTGFLNRRIKIVRFFAEPIDANYNVIGMCQSGSQQEPEKKDGANKFLHGGHCILVAVVGDFAEIDLFANCS